MYGWGVDCVGFENFRIARGYTILSRGAEEKYNSGWSYVCEKNGK